MAEEDQSMMSESAFVMTDENNQELEQELDDSGEFKFKTLPSVGGTLASQSATEGNFNPGQLMAQEQEAEEKKDTLAEAKPSKEESITQSEMSSGIIADDLKLHEVLFMFNSVRVSDKDRYFINQEVLKKTNRTNEPVLVVDCSCDLGSIKEQQRISLLRANQIKAYLVSMGVDENRIEVTGIGSTLDNANSTYETRAANRKVEIYLLGG